MAWISLLFFIFNIHAAELPRFLTKHSPETLRFISMDGRYAYVQKKTGVLGLVSSFKNTDFLSDSHQSDFLVRGSRFKQRLVIEAIPNAHDEYNLNKNHKILVTDFGNSVTREVGKGRNARLHLNDEWISYFDTLRKVIHLQNLVTQKKYEVILSNKANPFFIPDVEMINSSTLAYTDINEAGYSALVSFNLISKSSNIVYRTPQTATRIELCQHENYLAVGEFPYDGVSRGSKILQIKTKGEVSLGGHTTLYSSIDQDVGNLVCLSDSVYFVKTINQDKQMNHKTTEAVRLDLKSGQLQTKSNLKHVSQLVEMDGRVLIPFRGEFFVLEGTPNLGEDILKSVPNREELQLDI